MWDGGGLTSTWAANQVNHATTLGVMSSAEFFTINPPGTLFSGQSVGVGDTLVRYTWYGDTDFNGAVNFDDYARVDTGFNNSFAGWINGDFDLNGRSTSTITR